MENGELEQPFRLQAAAPRKASERQVCSEVALGKLKRIENYEASPQVEI